MINKILIIIVLIPLLINNIGSILSIAQEDSENINIKIAIYTDDEINEDFWKHSYTRYFVFPLQDYSWTAGEKRYSYNIEYINTNEIMKNNLIKNKYDVLIYPPDTADEYIIQRALSPLKNYIIKQNIQRFIKAGGGYFGTCGGAFIASNMINDPTSFLERIWKKTCMSISCTNFQISATIPIVNQILKNPENTGTHGYIFYSGWDIPPYVDRPLTGACLDCTINKNHPIFDDYPDSTQRIRWIAAPNLIIPENCDRHIDTIASFPTEEISDNESTNIHHWMYTGGIKGLIKGLLNQNGGEIHWIDTLPLLMKPFLFAEDWTRLEAIVKTNVSEKPFMTAEIYPNEHKARIVLCTGHPELNTWWGGYIEEIHDHDHNNIYEGFHQWLDVKPYNKTTVDEVRYNFPLIRRSVAWASQKVSDEELPPAQGPSEVKDFLNFYINSCLVKCIVEDPNVYEYVTLDLYYRFKEDNIWSNWKFYKTDQYYYDGWSFEFNAPEGPGLYQFYSIRKIIKNGIIEIEQAPLNADSTVYIDYDL